MQQQEEKNLRGPVLFQRKENKRIVFTILSEGNRFLFTALQKQWPRTAREGSFVSVYYKNDEVRKIELLTKCEKSEIFDDTLE